MLNYLKELLTLSKLFKFKRIFGVFFSTFVVVQFSMSDSLSPLVDSLYIISHQVPFVKWFLKSFLFSFSEPRSFLCFAVVSRWQLSYYIISPSPLSTGFSQFFARFWHFVEGYIRQLLSTLLYIKFVQTLYFVSHHVLIIPIFLRFSYLFYAQSEHPAPQKTQFTKLNRLSPMNTIEQQPVLYMLNLRTSLC